MKLCIQAKCMQMRVSCHTVITCLQDHLLPSSCLATMPMQLPSGNTTKEGWSVGVSITNPKYGITYLLPQSKRNLTVRLYTTCPGEAIYMCDSIAQNPKHHMCQCISSATIQWVIPGGSKISNNYFVVPKFSLQPNWS